jgi:hypothetical protein
MAGKKGVPHTAEHTAKIAAALTGRKLSKEHRRKIAEFQTGKRRGPMPPQTRAALLLSNRTRVVSEETRQRMSEAQKARAARGEAAWQGKKRAPFSQEWKDKIGAGAKGRPGCWKGVKRGKYPPSWCKAISEGQKGRKLSPEQIAKLRMMKPRHKKRVPYGDHVMRSTYEVRVAQALDRLGVKWEYEPRRFDLGYSTYAPDFYLTDPTASGRLRRFERCIQIRRSCCLTRRACSTSSATQHRGVRLWQSDLSWSTTVCGDILQTEPST